MMNDLYDVSIIVSVLHPNPEYLKGVILSAKRLVEKSHQKVELLLGNDGSPAEEGRIFDECAALAPELVKLFHFPVNRGIGRTRTVLIRKSRGRYIMPFDGDDILLPFDLDGEIAFLDTHWEYGASYAVKYLFNENGLTGMLHGAPLSDFQSYFTPKVNINAMLMRREVVDACHGFRRIPESRINDDDYLILRMIRESKLHFSAEGRALYRIHNQSISHLYSEMQGDHRYMARATVRPLFRLSRQSLAVQIPVVPPEHRRISAAVAGAALFLYQKDQSYAYWLLQKAVEIFPDDYGAWEHYLFFGCHRWPPAEIFARFRDALRRFDGDVSRQLPILNNLPILQQRRIPIPPEWMDLYRHHQRQWYMIPEIAQAHVPKPAVKPRPSYSFVMPAWKVK